MPEKNKMTFVSLNEKSIDSENIRFYLRRKQTDDLFLVC